MSISLTFLCDKPASGSENMQKDLALFERLEKSTSGIPFFCRFYSWSEPTISVGYTQDIAKFKRDYPNMPVVARATGGGAVFHHPGELTYCLVFPRSFLPSNIMASCLTISNVLLAAVNDFGVAAKIDSRNKGQLSARDGLCFTRPAAYEVLVGNSKLIGSAQKRGRVAVLQHGSIGINRPVEESLVQQGQCYLSDFVKDYVGLQDKFATVLKNKLLLFFLATETG